MAAVSMRSAGGRVQEPPFPHLQFRYPHCVPILITMVLDSSHNLRMIHEGRTIVTILVYYSKSRMLSIFNLSTLRYSIQNPPYLMDFLDLKS